jgi:hypothetical protein
MIVIVTGQFTTYSKNVVEAITKHRNRSRDCAFPDGTGARVRMYSILLVIRW